MKRLLTAGIFGTILGIVGAGTANASIVSSGFLDEKLTEYALSTSLDLKANQTDLTALSNKIGTLPSAISATAWTAIPYYSEYGVNMPDNEYPLPTTIGEQLEFLLNAGDSPIDRMFRVITMLGGNVETDDDPGANFLGLHPLTQKVRSIEENITLSSGVQIIPSKGLAFLLPEPTNSTYPTSIKDFMFDIYTGYWSVSFLANAVYFGNEHMGQKDPALVVKGLRQITDEIGTLPSGDFPEFPGYEHLSYIGQPLTYPTSLAELITALYGNSETDSRGLLSGIITGFPLNGNPDEYVGLMQNFNLANDANYLANANATKIGTVPSGKNLAGMISETDAKIGVLPPDTTVTGMMGNPVLLHYEQNIIPLYDLILFGSKGLIVANPITGAIIPFPLLGLHDITAKVNKIGDLPTEYATVGAALTAIKGIAEDAKAAALAAIPDPKQEGSSGKFVLTVDIVGDNATYHWEKIDREGETTTTE